jgi:hypothetical protein
VSIVAVIVIAVVALLLLAMLVAGGRRAAAARHAELGPAVDDVHPYRSHAEASRRDDGKT